MTKVIIASIRLYKKLFHVFRETRLPFYIHTDCKFYPSCSDFAIESINKHGALKGSIKSVLRIVKCSPLYKAEFNKS